MHLDIDNFDLVASVVGAIDWPQCFNRAFDTAICTFIARWIQDRFHPKTAERNAIGRKSNPPRKKKGQRIVRHRKSDSASR